MESQPTAYAVIFDMDGVIVDSELHWKSTEGFFLQSLIPGWTSADQDQIIGLSVHDLYRLLTTQYGVTLSKEQFLVMYQGMADEIYGQKASLLPGFCDLLTSLKAQGIPLALASSSPMSWINIVLDRFGLRSSFDVVVSADQLEEGRGKPSPAIYLLTVERLGVPPQRCVVIEDSMNGALSAKRAGMFCIGLRNGFNEEQDLSSADVVVDSFDIEPLIAQWLESQSSEANLA